MTFNRQCADWVYTTIAKMDDAEAQLYATMVVNDVWQRDMEANERLLRGFKTRYDAAVTAEVAKACLDQLEAGEDPTEVLAVAAAVAIAKVDDPWKYQERNPSNGQFGRMTRGEYRARKKALKYTTKAGERKARGDLKVMRMNRSNYDADKKNARGAYDTGKRFQEGWNAETNNDSTTSGTFRRIEAGGKLVQDLGVTAGKPGLATAGLAARYAGKFGPEAEKVVGPSMRKTSYRYRGTERKPDPAVEQAMVQRAKAIFPSSNPVTQKREPVLDAKGKPELRSDGKPMYRPVATNSYRELPEAQKNLVARLGAQDYLLKRLPSPQLANLHIQSGKIPPSEGILIDAKGEVVSQAVGFAEDHYLPFNLKNLAQAKGGQYVRSRTTGGPTTEDIYTGLMSGARSVTVVSRSGTFTVDFDDALRGSRRYSDTAQSMVKRYEQTLDAVQSENVRKVPISRREVAEIRADLEDEVKAQGLTEHEYPEEMFENELKARVAKRKKNPVLTRDDYAEIDREATKGFSTNPSEAEQKQITFARKQLERQRLAEKGNANFKLDGEGYKSALDGLREQYPYFIDKVTVNHNRSDPEAYSDSNDLGYVKPRFIHPAAVKMGYNGEGIGSPKIGADRIQYQNYRNRNRRGADADSQGPDDSAPPPSTPPSGARSEAAFQDSVKAAQAQRDQTTVKAGSWWAEGIANSVRQGSGTWPRETPILKRLHETAPDQRAAVVAEHGDALREEIAWASGRAPESVRATAPKVIYNPPARPSAAAPGAPRPQSQAPASSNAQDPHSLAASVGYSQESAELLKASKWMVDENQRLLPELEAMSVETVEETRNGFLKLMTDDNVSDAERSEHMQAAKELEALAAYKRYDAKRKQLA